MGMFKIKGFTGVLLSLITFKLGLLWQLFDTDPSLILLVITNISFIGIFVFLVIIVFSRSNYYYWVGCYKCCNNK